MAELRVGGIEPPFDAAEAIVHPVETKTHLRDFRCHVRDTSLDRVQPSPLLALFVADLVKLITNSAQIF
jgi:hypothetical protein